MKHIKLYEYFKDYEKSIIVFRGQYETFFNEKLEIGYTKTYGLFYTTPYINSAYFYTKPGQYDIREITVFEIPDNIAVVSGVYIDRLGYGKIQELKKMGYSGVTSNIGELFFDSGEIGLFDYYPPVHRFQTKNGKFSDSILNELKKFGLSESNIEYEKNLLK
jgi:hypothetical protein